MTGFSEQLKLVGFRLALQNQKLVHQRRLLPDTWLTKVWSYVVTVFSLYNFIWSPIDLALNDVNWAKSYWHLDVTVTIVFAANIVVSLTTAMVNADGLLITDLKLVGCPIKLAS